MPEFTWDKKRNAYVKECSSKLCARKIFIGTDSEKASREIFQNYFSPGDRYDDGFYPRCRDCNGASKHKREIIDKRALLVSQDGRCLICEEEIEFSGDYGCSAVIDHDHATGKVRGILCQECNKSLGKVERITNGKRWLYLAIGYLERHRTNVLRSKK